jgi:hypothetical protein
MSWRGQASGSYAASQVPTDIPPPKSEPIDLWYMVYKAADGQVKTVKGTTEGVRRNVRDGQVGAAADIVVSRTKHGQFRPLQDVAEFRDLVTAATPPPRPAPPSGRYVVAPDAAAAPLSGNFSVAPTAAQPPSPAEQDTTAQYSITPITHPPAERVPAPDPSPVRKLLPWVLVAAAAAAAGAGVTALALK